MGKIIIAVNAGREKAGILIRLLLRRQKEQTLPLLHNIL